MPADALYATDAAAALGKGKLTPRKLVEQCLDRIDEREASIRAWASLDRAALDAELERIEAMPEKARGPLWGIPVGVKDIIDTADDADRLRVVDL